MGSGASGSTTDKADSAKLVELVEAVLQEEEKEDVRTPLARDLESDSARRDHAGPAVGDAGQSADAGAASRIVADERTVQPGLAETRVSDTAGIASLVISLEEVHQKSLEELQMLRANVEANAKKADHYRMEPKVDYASTVSTVVFGFAVTTFVGALDRWNVPLSEEERLSGTWLNGADVAMMVTVSIVVVLSAAATSLFIVCTMRDFTEMADTKEDDGPRLARVRSLLFWGRLCTTLSIMFYLLALILLAWTHRAENSDWTDIRIIYFSQIVSTICFSATIIGVFVACVYICGIARTLDFWPFSRSDE